MSQIKCHRNKMMEKKKRCKKKQINILYRFILILFTAHLHCNEKKITRKPTKTSEKYLLHGLKTI